MVVDLGTWVQARLHSCHLSVISYAVCEAFAEYTTFIGGSSSFDIVPHPHNKLYALDKYCRLYGYRHDEVVFLGDDYGPGGNDEQVFTSNIRCIKVDNYLDFPAITAQLLSEPIEAAGLPTLSKAPLR